MKKIKFLFFVAILFYTIPTYSQVQNVHLSWNSTKKNATEKTMVITWSGMNLNKGIVKYDTDSSLSQSKQATSKYSDNMQAYIYKAELKNLQANTTYFYKCGSEVAGWSEIYSFKTAPSLGSDEKFVVGVWGDTQDNEFNTHFEKSEVIIQEMGKYPIQLTIHMGDIINTGSEVESWDRFFKITQPLNAKAPFMPVTGNHDVCNEIDDPIFQKPFPVFHDLFNLPRNNTDYSFNYGNTHFVAISSGHAKGVEEAGNINWRYAKDSPEYRWLEKDLADARKDKSITWIVLYLHHPLYSYGWSHVKGWQDRITPLLDKYNVDLCLAGHRHVYERHTAIRNNVVIPQEDNVKYQNPGGTVYITNGTAGGSPQGIGGDDLVSMVFTSPEKMYNYAIMTIEGANITYEVYNMKSEKIDDFKLSK